MELGGSSSELLPALRSECKLRAKSCVITPGPTDFRGLLKMLMFAFGGGSCLLRGLFAPGKSFVCIKALSSLGRVLGFV